jgi:hypothetical protein
MITETQLKIFGVLARKPFAEYTRNQIKQESKEKSNNSLALFINQLKREEVILEKKVGKSGLLTLNLDNDLTYQYIALCNNSRINGAAKQTLAALKDEIGEITQFYSMVLYGEEISAEKNKEKNKKSNINIAVFIEDETKKEEIETTLGRAKSKLLADVNVRVILKAQMIEMLASRNDNLGKQIAQIHIAVHNHQIFYEIIKEEMNRGFRAQNLSGGSSR